MITGVFAGRYALDRELGHGGTAVVYLARDLQLDRMVAVKVLRPELAESVGAERFLREIKLNARLQHPSILPVLDSGAHDGHLYFVLPYMDGGTLRSRLERDKQLPLTEVVEITKTIAVALTYAHEHGLIHRDVKPENILFGEGVARLGDFGIAKALEQSLDESTTSTGIVRGTPPYMSPEQVSGGTYDGRTDIYSLACTVYEMLAGILPYVGPTQESVIAQKMMHPPRPLRVYRPMMSQEVEDTLARALAMSPADRFQTAREFAESLEAASHVSSAYASTGAAPRPIATLRRMVWGTGALVAVSAALLVWRFTPVGGAALDPNRVMVFPLAISGSRHEATLGEDAATMIGSALDGAGPLRSIDAWPLLDPALRDTIRKVTGPMAARFAGAHHSGRYVTGKIVVTGDSVLVLLDVWDTDSAAVIARAQVAGMGTELWRLTLRAVSEILPRVIPGSARNATSGWEDRNPAAIASFLLGESAFRRGQFAEALERYREAVGKDSLFGLAAIRGAQAATWKHQPEEAAAFVKVAARLNLARRYALLTRAYGAYLEGDADSAVVELRAAIVEDPRMAVAWAQLGEVYTHLLPTGGSPDELAEDAFERALALDSSATNVLFHPIQIALRRGNLRRAEPMLGRFLAAQPETTLARNVEIMAECVRRGAGAVRWEEHARTRPLPLVNAAFSLAAGGAHLSCARGAFQQILAVDTANNIDADGRRWVALIGEVGASLAQSRPREAAAAIDAFSKRWQYGTSLFLLAGPFDPLLGARAREVARTDSARYGPAFAGSPYSFRLWELGQWKLHEGDAVLAETVARSLDERARTSGLAMDRLLARSLEARITLARGDTAKAFELLRGIVPAAFPSGQLHWHEMAPVAGERLLLARLLSARGDHMNAIAMAEVIDSPGASIHLLFLQPSLALRGEAASALADPRMQSTFRQRMAALGSQ